MDNQQVPINDYDMELKAETRAERFMMFEKIFFWLEIIFIAIGVILFLLVSAVADILGNFGDFWINLVIWLWIGIILNFGVTLVRVIYYLFAIKKLKKATSIWRGIIVLILSPIGFIMYYILVFVFAIAGCEVA